MRANANYKHSRKETFETPANANENNFRTETFKNNANANIKNSKTETWSQLETNLNTAAPASQRQAITFYDDLRPIANVKRFLVSV